MGLLDKVKAYLNEEDPEDLMTDEELKPKKQKEPKKIKEPKKFNDKDNDSEDLGSPKKEKLTQKAKKLLRSKRGIMAETIDSSEISSAKASKAHENERKTIRDFCEQLVDVETHMQEIQREYTIVTSYLTDIQRIEELPIDMANDLIDTASRIERFDKSRQTYLQSENLLPMDQFNNLASLEDEVTDAIKRLYELEIRDSMLKNDMGYLEGEKEDLRYMRGEYTDTIIRLRSVNITVLVLFMFTMIILCIYSVVTKNSIIMALLVAGTIAVLSFAISYVRYIDLKSQIKDSDAKIKRAVSLLNKVKVKYINNTNTLDYIYEKYGVNSCKELEYQWEQYNTMVKDAKRYVQANAEFKGYCDKLVKSLTHIGVEDPYVWPKQTNAIIDRREMVEIKHGLIVRRQKLRERMETCAKIKDNAQTALRAAVSVDPGVVTYISETLNTYGVKINL